MKINRLIISIKLLDTILKSSSTLILSFLLIVPNIGLSQGYANNWVFGNFGLDFNKAPVEVTFQYAEHLTRGMGIISNDQGELLLYTDGFTVWNKHHQVMSNGEHLIPIHQTTSLQESIVIPKPGHNSIYYIFTTDPWNGQETSGLYYAEIDLTLDGGLGRVVSKGTRLLDATTNKLTAVLHSNNENIWVLAHLDQTNEYHAIEITANGVNSNPVISNIGRSNSDITGQLKASPDGRKAAVSFDDGNNRGLDVFDFDPSAGTLSNVMELSFEDFASTPLPEGIAFSSDASKLYIAESRRNSLLQFDLSLPTLEEIRDSRRIVYQFVYNLFYQLQLAPDGRIYITKGGGGGGTEHLGVIYNPNADAENVLVEENGLYLEGGRSFVNLTPNFIQNYFYRPDIRLRDNCLGEDSHFQISNLSGVEAVNWEFGDGNVSREFNPVHRYEQATEYDVKTTIHYYDRIDTLVRTITITPTPALDLGADKNVCSGYVLDAEGSYNIYKWNTGSTDRTIVPDTSGLYILTVSNSYGCESTDSVYLTIDPIPAAPSVENSSIYCQSDLETSKIVAEGTNIKWYADEGLKELILTGTNFYPEKTTTVYVTQSMNGCESLPAKVNIVVQETPAPPVLEDTDTVVCIDSRIGLKAFGKQLKWYDENSFLSNGDLLELEPRRTGKHIFYATQTINGCESPPATLTVEIVDYEDGDLFIPNVITPNDDGINDEFYVFPSKAEVCLGDFKMITIYNRSGKNIFQSSSRSFKWKPSGSATVYFYLIEFEYKSFRGHLTVLK